MTPPRNNDTDVQPAPLVHPEGRGLDLGVALQFGRDSAAIVQRLTDEDLTSATYLVEHAEDRTVELVTDDLEWTLPAPRRRHGVTKLHYPASLIEWVQRTAVPANDGDDTFDLYANRDDLEIVAVLNPARPGPAWQDHLGVVKLRWHPLYLRWASLDGRLVGQADFAGHVQVCSSDVIDPPALDLLEVAETLTLHATSKVSSAMRLRDGARHIVFDENVEASAGGGDREVDIPEILTIRVPMFEGGDPIDLKVRLMYRKVEGQVGFMLQVIDRVEAERAQFEELVLTVATELGVMPLYGTPATLR